MLVVVALFRWLAGNYMRVVVMLKGDVELTKAMLSDIDLFLLKQVVDERETSLVGVISEVLMSYKQLNLKDYFDREDEKLIFFRVITNCIKEGN